MMDRRAFIVCGVAAIAAPLAAEGQQAGKVYRIGILSPEILPPGLLETVRDELRQLGHIEGKTLTIEARNAEGRNERLPALADELLALKVDVILAVNTSAARAAKRATTTAPIVI